MKVYEKYEQYRKIAMTGDIILTHSRKPTAFAIRKIDKAHWHHSEIVVWNYGRLMGFGAHPGGACPEYLSKRIEENKWDDFMVLRPPMQPSRVKSALIKTYEYAELFNQYDYGMIAEIMTYELFGHDLNSGSSSKNICSELTRYYVECLGIKYNTTRPYFTPEDHLRFNNNQLITVI